MKSEEEIHLARDIRWGRGSLVYEGEAEVKQVSGKVKNSKSLTHATIPVKALPQDVHPQSWSGETSSPINKTQSPASKSPPPQLLWHWVEGQHHSLSESLHYHSLCACRRPLVLPLLCFLYHLYHHSKPLIITFSSQPQPTTTNQTQSCNLHHYHEAAAVLGGHVFPFLVTSCSHRQPLLPVMNLIWF